MKGIEILFVSAREIDPDYDSDFEVKLEFCISIERYIRYIIYIRFEI